MEVFKSIGNGFSHTNETGSEILIIALSDEVAERLCSALLKMKSLSKGSEYGFGSPVKMAKYSCQINPGPDGFYLIFKNAKYQKVPIIYSEEIQTWKANVHMKISIFIVQRALLCI